MKKLLLFIFIIQSSFAFSQCFPDRHSTNWFDAWISCKTRSNPNPVNPQGHWILYDLTDLYEIDKIKIWNVNDPDHLNWGMKDIRLEYSEDSLIWTTAADFKLLQGEGNNRYEGMDWMDVNIPKARYILVTGLSNYGGSCYGLAELKFSAEKIKIITETGNPQLNTELQVTILPNPFEDLFRAEFRGSDNEKITIEITDPFGKRIQNEQLELYNGYASLRIQSRKWPSGAYMLTAFYGNKIIHKQLIKM
jgi:hypothetical protein